MTDIAFEHFDPEIELCNVDENGRPIRPRKKPGRKPNPPSPAQRKAQNRAAQRAFRERKRREMREAEANVKRALYARDQAVREANKLRRRVKDLEYENKHLKGFMLTLKLACHAHRVDVPNYSDSGARDELGNEKMMESSSNVMPQNLEFFLDRHSHIVSLQDESLPKSIDPQSPGSMNNASTPSSSNYSISTAHNTQSSTLEQFLLSPPQHEKSMPGSFDFASEDPSSSSEPLPPLDLTQTATALLPQLQSINNTTSQLSQIDPSIFQGLMQTELVSGFIDQITRPEFTIDQTPPELAALLPPEWRTSLHDYSIRTRSTDKPDDNDDNNEPTIKAETIDTNNNNDHHMPDLWNSEQQQQESSSPTKPRYTVGPSGERIYPPMTPLEYLDEMRTIQRTDKKTWAFFEPTELQRNVPHDIRIDVIPGAMMRDQMILFQDYYDGNELFNFLFNTAMFMGGSPGNQDHWFVPPSFLRKYWFLVPNQKPPLRMDNSVEIVVYLGSRLQDALQLRKQMYYERERYIEHFPPPGAYDVAAAAASPSPSSCADQSTMQIEDESSEQHHHQQQHDQLSDDSRGDNNHDVTFTSPIRDDMPIDMIMNVMETMPRLTSPLPFE
ncbi:hypothetical protein RO3G_16615 [Lichtheimia corymbifera JMRC:FSU:9682]|uniref:BZIP domain-containing protein n=1 Tax=Lichtheimia corymbifera JMRC:FSU:9682 TaxID=1263082 RepID=A0A068RLW7_9FUNG|nr:hypothetical protein RO3G_16615 [Lichtheimia corymbifera JMRC:FSU:9682]